MRRPPLRAGPRPLTAKRWARPMTRAHCHTDLTRETECTIQPQGPGPRRSPRHSPRGPSRSAGTTCPPDASQGRYWTVGDVHGTQGTFSVRAPRTPRRRPGRWTDAATGERGDLLELIRLQLRRIGSVGGRARRGERPSSGSPRRRRDDNRARAMPTTRRGRATDVADVPRGRRLPRRGLPARARVIRACRDPALRFHPALYYRDARQWCDSPPSPRSSPA